MKYLAAAGGLLLALWPSGVLAAPAWEEWQSVAGVFDVSGPRADGSLVVAGSGALYTLTPLGDLQPFARGPGGYHDDPGTEAYIAVSPGQSVAASGCDFVRDDIFVLRLHVPAGITRVDKTGEDSGSFANSDTPGLSGIAFDTEGAFDHRLLAVGPAGGKAELMAIDCRGSVTIITRTAPSVEGGMAVAPETFGDFAGALIAPDENTGVIWAITPAGTAKRVVSGLPKGSDVGVESVAIVPPGFTSRGGYLYYADRKSPNTTHTGSDHVLRLSSTILVAAGVQEGDLLASTEGGASLYDVRCAAACTVTAAVPAPTSAHGEGHLAFTVTPPPPSPSPSPEPTVGPVAGGRPFSPAPFVAIAAAVLAAVVAATAASNRRRR